MGGARDRCTGIKAELDCEQKRSRNYRRQIIRSWEVSACEMTFLASAGMCHALIKIREVGERIFI